MDRRTYLSTLGVGIAGLAGCTGQAKQSDDGGEGIALSGIDVENTDDVAHTVRVLVKFDGELVHWSATEVAGFDSSSGDSGSVELDPTWPDEAGEVTVHARLDGDSEWATENLGDTIKGPCASVHLSVDRGDELTIMFSGGCETETGTTSA